MPGIDLSANRTNYRVFTLKYNNKIQKKIVKQIKGEVNMELGLKTAVPEY